MFWEAFQDIWKWHSTFTEYGVMNKMFIYSMFYMYAAMLFCTNIMKQRGKNGISNLEKYDMILINKTREKNCPEDAGRRLDTLQTGCGRSFAHAQ